MKYTVSLKKNYEFMKLYKRGTFYVGKHMVIYIFPNKKDSNRLGIALGKKFGNSVKRNRAKRLVRENYRFFEESIKKGLDIVIVARTTNEDLKFSDVKREMKYLFKKLKIFEEENVNWLRKL